MTDQVSVRKLNETGTEVFRYSAQVVRQTESFIVLEAIFDLEELEFHGLTFHVGDRFVETHYMDRWYNVLAVHDADTDQLKGWYCNIARPAQIEDGTLSSEDLALDLVVLPDGSSFVLDEDEFAELDLDPADRASAEAALQQLQVLAETLGGPFAVTARS